MKKRIKFFIIYLLILPLCITLFGTGCEKEEFVPKEYFKFSDFGCESFAWHLKENNKYYIIKSKEEFNNSIISECIPQINFTEYVVLAGSKNFTTGASVFDEEVEVNNKEIVYTVTILTDYTNVPTAARYHVVIKKPLGNKKIKIDEIVTDRI